MMESKAHGRLPPQSYFYEFLQITYSTFSFQDQQGYFLQMIPLTFMQGCLEDFSKKKKKKGVLDAGGAVSCLEVQAGVRGLWDNVCCEDLQTCPGKRCLYATHRTLELSCNALNLQLHHKQCLQGR